MWNPFKKKQQPSEVQTLWQMSPAPIAIDEVFEDNYALTGPVGLSELDQNDKFYLYWMVHTDGLSYAEKQVNGMANAVKDIIKHIDMTQKNEYRMWLDNGGPDKYEGPL